ncbi:MAG: adenylate/guanylate cyclase domain-containing protein [Actinomycetota bacterium]
MLRVVLAEDNLLVREGTKMLLASTGEIEVVGAAADAIEAAKLVAELEPDALITDIRMPPEFRLEGIELALRVRTEYPKTGVIVLSSHDDPEYAIALFKDGSQGLGYLLKERVAEPEQLIRAVREVAAGGSAMDPKVVDALVHREAGAAGLTAHEQELLDLMNTGCSYDEMSVRLGIPPTAVDHEVSQVLAKLADAASRGVEVAISELRKLHSVLVQKERNTVALSKYLSPQVARSVVTEGPMEPTKVEVSVVFTDIRGFTTLSETTEVATLGMLLNEHLAAMSELVLAHDGIVDKFIGDAVMAVFGAPVTLEDHASKAVDCAQAMIARQAELNAVWVAAGHPPFGVGIGVNTGNAMAGAVGGAKLEYTVVGDAVNVAQRLNSLAGPAEVVISAETATAAGLLQTEFETVSVKGREQPVRVMRIAAPMAGGGS